MQAHKLKQNPRELEVIGVMSGTSLDGLDLAWCRFRTDDLSHFDLLSSKTLPYQESLQQRLADAVNISSEDLFQLDADLGTWFGKQIADFIGDRHPPDAIASHGHTIFHQPNRGFTVQIGNAAHIKAATGLPVISDFRSLDVALGGQGAPLVPVGDRVLFGEYEYCLNLGGIANISYEKDGDRVAYDITFCNMVLNHLSKRRQMEYDKGGQMASEGKIDANLLNALDKWSYYSQTGPRSLGFEQVSAEIFPLLEGMGIPDLLHTCVIHITRKIAESCDQSGKLLLTGGGAHNDFLRMCLQQELPMLEVIYPERWLVDYKEAIVFALLGTLRIIGQTNVLASVTGASHDSVGGQFL